MSKHITQVVLSRDLVMYSLIHRTPVLVGPYKTNTTAAATVAGLGKELGIPLACTVKQYHVIDPKTGEGTGKWYLVQVSLKGTA